MIIIDAAPLVTSSLNPLSNNFGEEAFCVSLDEVQVPDNESCEDELVLDARIIDTRTGEETCEEDESEVSQNRNELPTVILTTPVRSIRARQFFPSSSQTKKSESVSSLRDKLVQNEVECMHKLNDSKIKIAQAEHKARMDLLLKQSLAAEAQIDFWNTASSAIIKFAENEHRLSGITDLARKAVYVDSIQQTETVLGSTEVEE